MEQIRPFPQTDLIDRAEEKDTICLESAVELKEWVIKNFLTIGGVLHNPDHIATNFILGMIESLILLLFTCFIFKFNVFEKLIKYISSFQIKLYEKMTRK